MALTVRLPGAWNPEPYQSVKRYGQSQAQRFLTGWLVGLGSNGRGRGRSTSFVPITPRSFQGPNQTGPSQEWRVCKISLAPALKGIGFNVIFYEKGAPPTG